MSKIIKKFKDIYTFETDNFKSNSMYIQKGNRTQAPVKSWLSKKPKKAHKKL